MKNIAYAGTLVAALQRRHGDRRAAARREVRGAKRRCANRITRRCAWATITPSEHFDCPLPFHLEKMNANSDKILIDGNTAIALGCVYAGATVAAWYPITPSTSVMDAFKVFCEKYRKDPETGQEQLHHHSGRGRAGRHRHGDRRGMERRARVHLHRRAGHFADERTARAWPITPKSPPSSSMCSAWARPPACPRAPSRAICSNAPTRRTATPNIFCCFRRIRPSASNSRPSRFRSRGALPDAGVHAVRSRHRHERLGGAAPQMGRRVISPTAAAC